MTASSAAPARATFSANPAENYERYFVPRIGEPTARHLLDVARPEPGERVLDLACGTGVVTRLAYERVGAQGGSVTGVDPNDAMLAVARAAGPEGIEWVQAAAEDLPGPDASVDLVLCSLGMQFFADRAAAAREMHRVLAPGGRAVWCTPGPTPPIFEAIDQALTHHVGPGAAMFVHAVFALHDPAEARGLMADASFSVKAEVTSVPYRVPAPADFFWEYVHSTPLLPAVGELGETERAALEAEVVERCAALGGDPRDLEPALLVVTATKGE